MATSTQLNPTFDSSLRTVVLHKRADQQSFGFYIGEDVPAGLYVVTVERDSSAAEAQIQPGDRVLAVNGQMVSTMSTNPKQTLVSAASHGQSLSLIIQSTDIYQALNIPLNNSYTNKENNRHTHPQQSQRTTNLNSDLERYIKSLFVNEHIQILPAPPPALNHHEFILNPVAHGQSLPHPNSSSMRSHRKKHRRAKRVLLVTKETQTNTDQDENIPHQQPPSPPRSYLSSLPSMGTSHRILRTQQTNPSDNESNGLQNTKIPSSDVNHVPEVVITQPSPVPSNLSLKPPAVSTPKLASAVRPLARADSPENNSSRPQHMVDIVREAMAAKGIQNKELANHQTNISRSNAPVSGVPSSDDRSSAHEGTYNVPNAREQRGTSQPASNPTNLPVTIRDEGVRRLHLRMAQNFQGYGFHLQYNKVYFLVQSVESKSPAEKGDLRPNDVILSVNNQPTNNMPHSTFVQLVTNSSQIDFTVQSLNDYQRVHPQSVSVPIVPTTTANRDEDKSKNVLSRALEKISSIR